MLELVLNSRCFTIIKETKKSIFCKYQYNNIDDFIKDVKELNYTYNNKIFNVNINDFTILIDK